MKVEDALRDVRRLFVDTAPVIYFVEQNPNFQSQINAIFEQVDAGQVRVVNSPITLAECLIGPMRSGDEQLQSDFQELLVRGAFTEFVTISEAIAVDAARLRAAYNVSLADALQLATAVAAQCDAFLTNDKQLKRVSEIEILVVEDLTA
ncbi:MAG: PIN domain-containing protein [Ardenticatenaceae bacterium]|nr:PIN domain-containing protein [Anaerolineales bacterium]MCB9006356.1 PIN domain-containing protein [Ardenticatenaceae bacterium]